jgi:hypothetical protein
VPHLHRVRSCATCCWDEDLGFMYGDGGDISFYGAPEDMRAGRWDRLEVTPDSS